MRRVVGDQIKALSDLSEIITRHGKTLDLSSPALGEPRMRMDVPMHAMPAASAPEPFLAVISAVMKWINAGPVQKSVAAPVAARLAAAHKAIAQAKARLAFGAGNQIVSAVATGGNSSARSERRTCGTRRAAAPRPFVRV